MSRFSLIFLGWLFFATVLPAQTHPRLFFGPDDVATIRARAATPELAPAVAAIQWMTEETNGVGNDPFAYDFHKQFGNYAILYLATGNPAYADQARDETLYHMARTDWWANDSYKALRRGALSRGAALSYDFCFHAWAGQTVPASVTWRGSTVNLPAEYVGLPLNTAVSRALQANARSLIRSGGGEWPGDEAIGNNWFSVRFAGALLGILASDEAGLEGDYTTALSKFSTYLKASLGTNPAGRGWNPEGYGYAFYPAQFTFPALIALERLKNVDLESQVPALPYALPVLYSGLVSIASNPSPFLGLHPDFTDDNPQWFGEGSANLAFAFAPEAMLPALKWMYRRAFGDLGDNKWDATSVGGLYALLYYPLDVPEANPADVPAFGRNWDDPVSGFFSTRKAYADGNDVLTQFHSKSRKNEGGHNGPDGSTFRVFALGVPWVVGSGRTTDGAGQSTVFASDPIGGVGYQSVLGTVPNYYMRPGGGGFWVARNQPFGDTGVRNWTRRLIADYNVEDTAAFYVVSDSSDNARFWRLNTPEFNTITTSGNQFIVTNATTGHRLIGTVLHPPNPTFRTGDFTRGSSYSFRGQSWQKNNWVDFSSPDGKFVVTMAIAPAGTTPPVPSFTGSADLGSVQMAGRTYSLAGDQIAVTGWERPVLSITHPEEGTVFTGGAQALNLVGTVTSPSGAAITGVSVSINGEPVGEAARDGTAWTFATPVLPRGFHNIRLRATDANLEWTEKSVSVGINQTQPPEVSISSPADGASLPAAQSFVLRGQVADPEGGATSLTVYRADEIIGTVVPTGGRWIFPVPASEFPIGNHAFHVVATDSSGDTSRTPSVTVTASSRYSAVPFYGDLANWTTLPSDTRVSLVNFENDTRWYVEPTLGYSKRNGQLFLDGTSLDTDFRLTFRIRPVTGRVQVLFGNQVYLTLGAAGDAGSLRYTGWGDKPIGSWQQPFFPALNAWYEVEISRIGKDITIKRDGTIYTVLTLNDDGSCTVTPDIITEDLVFGWREKYRWYKNFWSGGPIGLGAVFDDASSFYMDDFRVEVLSGDQPPSVALTSPVSGAIVASGIPVTLSGTASDPENALTVVDVLAGSKVIAAGVPVVNGEWTTSWTPPSEAVYGLVARVRDAKNNVSRSSPATLVVGSGNTSPTVRLSRPVPGAGVSVNSNTDLIAEASDADGAVVAVRFYVNNVPVGTDDSAPYQIIWKPPVTGSAIIAAEVVDDLEAITRTSDVTVTVTSANSLPTAALTSPGDLAAVNAGSSVTLSATATDNGGSIAKVDFYANGEWVATDTTAPYSVTWAPPGSGTVSLMAVATDNTGGTGYSTTRTLFVTSPGNTAPTVALTAPANGTAFRAPLPSIEFRATANDTDGSIHRVEFFSGSTKIGEDRSAPYAFTWSNVQVGNYTVTARAVDNEGGAISSAGIAISLAYPPGTESSTEPLEDAYVTQNATANTGALTELRTQDKTRSYLRFPVSIPSDAILKAARIRFFANTGRTLQNLAFQSDDSWQESTILWSNAPTVGSLVVSDFSSSNNQTIEFDVTAQALSELSGDGQLSFTLGAAGNSYQAAIYGSRENPDPARRPRLTLTYNRLPTATVQAPFQAPAGTPVSITVSASDPDGSVAAVSLAIDGSALESNLTTAPFQTTWTSGAPGVYTLTVTVTDNLGDTREISHDITIVPVSDGFSSWLNGFPGVNLQTGATDDPDHDQAANLLEYAFDTDPSDTRSQPVISPDIDENRLTLTFTPRRISGVAYIIQAGDDLSQWSETTLSGLAVGQPHTFVDSADLTSEPRRFLRLLVRPQ